MENSNVVKTVQRVFFVKGTLCRKISSESLVPGLLVLISLSLTPPQGNRFVIRVVRDPLKAENNRCYKQMLAVQNHPSIIAQVTTNTKIKATS